MATVDCPAPGTLETSVPRDDGPDIDVLGMSPYHASAGAVVNAGAVCMLAFALLGVPLPWIGFFIGAVPTFLVLAKAHAAGFVR